MARLGSGAEPVRVITVTAQTAVLSYATNHGSIGFWHSAAKRARAVMSERIIDIPGQRCTVEVHQLGKAYWVAVGEYWDEKIRTRGTTERKALKAWRRAISDKSKSWIKVEKPKSPAALS